MCLVFNLFKSQFSCCTPIVHYHNCKLVQFIFVYLFDGYLGKDFVYMQFGMNLYDHYTHLYLLLFSYEYSGCWSVHSMGKHVRLQ